MRAASHLQDLDVRRVVEIMVGTDDFRAVFAAEVLKILAHLRRGLYLEVGEAGAGRDGQVEAVRRVVRRGAAVEPAGRDERGVGFAEEFFDLLVREGTEVQADFRHLDRRVLEDFEDLRVGLILQAGANHPGL